MWTEDVLGLRLFTGTRPHAVWSRRLQELEDAFLRGLDCGHFEYQAQVHSERLSGNEDEAQRAAVALRVAYGIGLETLMALLSAVVQAPHCVSGWMTLYRSNELGDVVRALLGKGDVPTLPSPGRSWKALAGFAFPSADESHRRRFASAWRRMAEVFLDERKRADFNAGKHGMRVRPGGNTFGAYAEDDASKGYARSSRFGSSFLIAKAVTVQTGSPALDKALETVSLNWDPIALVEGLRIVSASVTALVSALLVQRGHDPLPSVTLSADAFTKAHDRTPNLHIINTLDLDYGTATDAVEEAYGLAPGDSRKMRKDNEVQQP